VEIRRKKEKKARGSRVERNGTKKQTSSWRRRATHKRIPEKI
jgi:hypothetical protein